MTINYRGHGVTLHHGDALDVLRSLPDASVHAVVTDPPYGLEFMGKDWDAPWKRRGENPGSAGMSTGGFTSGNGYANRETPTYGKGWRNLRCTLCGHITSGASPCVCPAPVLVSEGPGAVPAMRAFQSWCELWAVECLRVLRPGGHLLAFGGTRTWHRLACAVEDAGFEIRDSIAWLYGSGFSKSWNFNTMYKGEWCSCTTENALPYNYAGNADLPRVRDDIHPPAVARREGEDAVLLAEVQRSGQGSGVGDARPQGASGVDAGVRGGVARTDDGRDEPGMGGRLLHRAGQGLPDDSQAGSPAGEGERLRGRAPSSDGSADRATSDAARGGASHQRRPGGQPTGEPEALPGSHESLDDGALRDGAVCSRCGGLDPVYKGFGTGIKPAFEPVVVARKPLVGTVAANVTTHGTGALNIDACRIGLDGEKPPSGSGRSVLRTSMAGGVMHGNGTPIEAHTAGRWPANVVLDDHQAAALDQMSGTLKGRVGMTQHGSGTNSVYGRFERTEQSTGGTGIEDTGGASRFFYVAKAPKRERPVVDGVAHPTVKPLTLMRWLVRLVTPPGGTVLEPFAGSGTTVEACIQEGFRCIAIEKGDEYLPLIRERIRRVTELPEVAELVRTADPAQDDAAYIRDSLFNITGEETA